MIRPSRKWQTACYWLTHTDSHTGMNANQLLNHDANSCQGCSGEALRHITTSVLPSPRLARLPSATYRQTSPSSLRLH